MTVVTKIVLEARAFPNKEDAAEDFA